MKKQVLFSTGIIITSCLFIALNSFKPAVKKAFNNSGEQCFDWQKSNTSFMQFRWCKDVDLRTTSYQFFNGYQFEVWYFFKINYTNGEFFTGNTFLNSGEYSDKGAMYNRTPASWQIVKKRKKDSDGKWIDF